MRKTSLSLCAAAVMAAFGMAAPADAACFWNGYGYACGYAPPAYGYRANDFNNPATHGYVPRGLPHPNGAQTGGGGCYQGQAKNGCGDE